MYYGPNPDRRVGAKRIGFQTPHANERQYWRTGMCGRSQSMSQIDPCTRFHTGPLKVGSIKDL